MNMQTLMNKINTIDEASSKFVSLISEYKPEGAAFEHSNAVQELSVFKHHIYEYKKGLRNLVLTTEKAKNENTIKNTLKKSGISFLIHNIDKDKMNVYFGANDCVEVVKTLNPMLNNISPSEDFILGIMVGYDRLNQCKRYLKLKDNVFV